MSTPGPSVAAALRTVMAAALFAALSQGQAVATELSCPGCNLVLINLDFLRADYVGPSGVPTRTPNIDRFFAKAVVFDNAYATAGSTYRGNLSVFTATAPHYFALDIRSFTRLIDSKSPGVWERVYRTPETLAQRLSAAGYRTVSINKGRRSGHHTWLDRGFDDYQDFPLNTLIEDLVPPVIEVLETLDSPFMLHLHAIPTRLHKAYYPVGRAHIESQDIQYRAYHRGGKPYGYTVISDYKASHARRRIAEHAIYAQQLEYADEQLGALFAALEPILHQSIVVLFSTHGTQLGDNGVFASDGSGYQPNIRVPLMIRHPAVSAPRRIAARVSMLDLVPTLLDLVDLEAPNQDGASLLPLLLGEVPPRDYVWGMNDEDEFIISGNWKLLRQRNVLRTLTRSDDASGENVYLPHRAEAMTLEFLCDPGGTGSRTLSGGGFELEISVELRSRLFDLDTDPGEGNDLAAEHPSRVAELESRLDAMKLNALERIRGFPVRPGECRP